MNESRPLIDDLPEPVVSAILGFALERRIRSAHYVGNANRALIEGLAGIVGRDPTAGHLRMDDRQGLRLRRSPGFGQSAPQAKAWPARFIKSQLPPLTPPPRTVTVLHSHEKHHAQDRR
jgi:hypothetical protein